MAINKDSIQATNPQAFYASVKPFIAGSRTQLERYLEAQRKTHTYHMTGHYVDVCLYELSSLLEHLDTIETQLRGIGVNLPLGQHIRDIRTHVRHDARGEIDKRSEERAKRLGLKEGLQVGIEFIDDGVKVGKTELTSQNINHYIDTTETIAWALFMGGKIEIEDDNINVFQQDAKITVVSNKT